MATATATATVDATGPKGYRIFNDMDMMHVWGTLAIQASPATYATGGLAISWTIPGIDTANLTPYHVEFFSVNGGLYEYEWNAASGKFQLFSASAGVANAAPFQEFTNATAIPANVSSDTIRFHAIFQRS